MLCMDFRAAISRYHILFIWKIHEDEQRNSFSASEIMNRKKKEDFYCAEIVSSISAWTSGAVRDGVTFFPCSIKWIYSGGRFNLVYFGKKYSDKYIEFYAKSFDDQEDIP